LGFATKLQSFDFAVGDIANDPAQMIVYDKDSIWLANKIAGLMQIHNQFADNMVRACFSAGLTCTNIRW